MSFKLIVQELLKVLTAGTDSILTIILLSRGFQSKKLCFVQKLSLAGPLPSQTPVKYQKWIRH